MPNCYVNLSTLNDFEAYRDVPEAFAYMVYSITKFIICVVYFIVVCNKYYLRKCDKHCFCVANKAVFWCWKQCINLLFVIVGVVFGAPLGVVERSSDEYEITHERTVVEPKDEAAACLLTVCVSHERADSLGSEITKTCSCKHDDKNIINSIPGLQTLYIRGNKLETNEVLVLAAVTVPFIVAIVTTFWDRYSLEETYSCTEDPEIYCFPLAIAPTTNADLNISHFTPKISDCSIWTTGDISANVTFRCFKCVNNLEDAFAALGGLLTIFKIVIKAGISFLLVFTEIAISKVIMNDCCRCIKSRDSSKAVFKCLRIILAVILAIIEFFIGITIGAAYAQHRLTNGTLTDHKSTGYTIFEHLNEPLVVVGIVTTSLLLPLEEFAIIGGRGYLQNSVN